MNFSTVIKKENDAFYREAYRAKDIEEINESAGLKHLLNKEMIHLKNYAIVEIMKNLEFRIEESYDGFVLTLKEN